MSPFSDGFANLVRGTGRWRVRLWPRLALVMAALAALPVVAVGWQASRTVADLASTRGAEALEAEARLQRDLFGQWLRDQAPQILALREMVKLDELPPAGISGFIALVARVLPAAREVALVDAAGRPVVPPVVVGASDPGRPNLIAGLPLAEALATPEKVHMGRAWAAGAGERFVSFPLAMVVNPAAPAAERWVLGVRVSIEPTASLFTVAPPGRAVILLDEAGRVLLGDPRDLVDPAKLVPFLGTETAFATDEAHGVVVPVGRPLGWSIVLVEPSEALLASSASIRQNMAPQIAVAMVSAVALAFLFASSLSRPVERLRDAVLMIAEGRKGVRASVHRTDEIGDLARAFDDLAARLEEQQAEIEAFNRELQQRVEERTRELRETQEGLVRSGQLAAVAEIGAGLAHDLNNPLAAVLGLAQVLRARHPEEPMLVDLEAQAARCREVVEVLRRIQSFELDPGALSEVRVADLTAQAVPLIAATFRRRGVGLVSAPVATGLRARVDAVHGARILAQVSTAMCAGLDRGATVTLSAAASTDGTTVEIVLRTDRPIGSHPDRRDDWMASAHGLWVARQLLQRLGGRLDERASPAGRDGVEWAVSIPRAGGGQA